MFHLLGRIYPRLNRIFRAHPMRSPAAPQNLKRKILKDAIRENEQRDAAFRRIIRFRFQGESFDLWQSRGGAVPAPGAASRTTLAAHRRFRGEIELRGEAAAEQRLQLSMEGVRFSGKRVDIEIYDGTLRGWETLN
jgi:methylated-DNA-protein-cysteine methyltransferase-like protein